MNNCQKILELLQKDALSDNDQALINSLVNSDKEAADFYRTYLKIKEAAKHTNHLSSGDFYNYILIKNGQDPENKEIIGRLPAIELHLNNCVKCSDEFKIFNSEFLEIGNFVAGAFPSQAFNETKEIDVSILAALKRQLSFSRHTFITLIVLGFIYLGLYLTSPLTIPVTKKLAVIHDQSELYITRGRATNDFQKSLTALASNDYKSAIIYLNRDINKNQKDETIFYSYYILGLSHLANAEEKTLGIFPAFNQKEARLGIKALQSAVIKNNSGRYPNITLDAYYYLAKAELMIDEISQSKKYLNQVIELKGSRMRQAEDMLKALE